MKRPDYWWVPIVFFSVWCVAILFATITFGVWAGVAMWVGVPALFVAVTYAAATVEANHRARRETIARHPSTWGYPVDRWWNA
jgi:hypothetical protein